VTRNSVIKKENWGKIFTFVWLDTLSQNSPTCNK